MTRPHTHLVSSPAAWEVLVSPVRTEIAEALRLLGPCSVADVAQAIDRPADTLYRHIELLQEAGFVREAGFRKGDRNVEQLLDVVADDFIIEFHDSKGDAENKAIIQTVNSFTGAMQRAVRDSAAAKQLVFDAGERNLSINYELSWLTPEKFQEVRALIRRLKGIMDEGKKRREGRLYMTLAIATPVTRKRGAKQNTDDESAAPARRGGRRAAATRRRGPATSNRKPARKP
jgi:DNA-binding transcriptional ArsR family regulator